MPLRAARLPLAGRPSDPGQRRDPGLADHLAVAAAGHAHRPPRARDPVAASILPVIGAAGARRDPPGAARRDRHRPPTCATVGSGDDEPPVWRIDEDVVAGSVTVHVYEGGTTVLEDGRSLFSSERLDMTAFHDDPARADARERRRLSLARARLRDRDPGDRPDDFGRVVVLLRPAPRGRPRRRPLLRARLARGRAPPSSCRRRRDRRPAEGAGTTLPCRELLIDGPLPWMHAVL